MDIKKLLLASLGGFVVYFLLGWLLYGALLMDFFEANKGTATNVMRAENEMVWWALILGNFLYALALSYIFLKWTSISTLRNGAAAGALIGLLFWSSMDFNMYGTTNISSLLGVLMDIVVGVVISGLMGGVIGWILGRK